MKYLLVTLLALAQQDPVVGNSGKFEQHSTRTNRVWTLHVYFKTCGVTLTHGYTATIDENGEVGPWRQMPADRIFIQWSKEVPVGPTSYGIGDLLADYGQVIHLVRVFGYVGDPSNQFTKMMWVSPAGVSFNRIPRAPIRDSRYDRGLWNEDESLALANWINRNHQWSREDWLQEFRGLLWNMDKRVEVPLTVKAQGCAQAEAEPRDNAQAVIHAESIKGAVKVPSSIEGKSYRDSQLVAQF